MNNNNDNNVQATSVLYTLTNIVFWKLTYSLLALLQMVNAIITVSILVSVFLQLLLNDACNIVTSMLSFVTQLKHLYLYLLPL